MRPDQRHYRFFALASAVTIATFIGLPILPGSTEDLPVVGEAEPAAQSSKNPHEWGLQSRTVAELPAVQSAKNPHEWGLPSTTFASAPATQSDKNPHAWGIVPPTKAARVVPGDR